MFSIIVKQYSVFADYYGFAFPVIMVSFVLKMASAIDIYLLSFRTIGHNRNMAIGEDDERD